MSTLPLPQERNFRNAMYPLQPVWDVPRQTWHDTYPVGVPPALDFTPLRTEHLLFNNATRFSRRVAMRYFGTQWTYAEFLGRVRRAAAAFHESGLQPGDRVMLVLPSCPAFMVAWFALHWIGVEVVPANPLLSAKDLQVLADKTDVHAVIGLDVRIKPVLELVRTRHVPLLFVASLRRHLPWALSWAYQLKAGRYKSWDIPQRTVLLDWERFVDESPFGLDEPLLDDPHLPAVLQPTGGTTGTPKVAVLSHANLHANVAQLHVWSGRRAGTEVVLGVLPFFHVFGSTVCLLSAVAGAATILPQANFNPGRVWNVMAKWKPTVAPMVPFMFRAMNDEMQRRGRNITGLDFCFSGAAPLSEDVKRTFEIRTGAKIFEGYGLSEASPVTHANPPDDSARTGSIGVPLPGTLAKVVDEDDSTREMPAGEVGELLIKGPQVMQGYLNEADESAAILRDGWLHTGDMAQVDENGFFQIVDRKKDMIITGGLNVFPTEVEEWLNRHDRVLECAVVGQPDERFGQQVTAYVVPVPGTTLAPAELEKFCRGGLAGYKVPRTIEVRTELPKNFLGKIRRIELREDAA